MIKLDSRKCSIWDNSPQTMDSKKQYIEKVFILRNASVPRSTGDHYISVIHNMNTEYITKVTVIRRSPDYSGRSNIILWDWDLHDDNYGHGYRAFRGSSDPKNRVTIDIGNTEPWQPGTCLYDIIIIGLV
jgi:hypothetical protein